METVRLVLDLLKTTWARRAWGALALLAFLLSSSLAVLSLPRLARQAQLQFGNEPPRVVQLPWSGSLPADARFTFTLVAESPRLGTGRVRVIPDDCVKALQFDGQPLPVPGESAACDYQRGFAVDLPAARGEHALSVTVLNKGGRAGVDLAPEIGTFGHGCAAVAIAALLFLLDLGFQALGGAWAAAPGFTREASWPLSYRIAFALGAGARLIYALSTGWRERTMDVQGHWDYIQYLLVHHALPRPSACWECYHPPLYYTIAAAVSASLRALPIAPPSVLQGLSLVCALAYLALGLVAVRSLTAGSRYGWLSGFVFALWPAAILHAPSIGNDALLHVFSAATLVAVASYWTDRSPRWILRASGFGGLAMLSKANGIIPLALLPAITLAELWLDRRSHERRRPALRAFVLSAGSAAVAFAISIGATALRVVVTHGKSIFEHNVLDDTMLVGTTPFNYLWFDAKTWFQYTFTDTRDDAQGRQFFWNFLGKTALFGEFQVGNGPVGLWFAAVVSALALVLVAVCVRALLRARRWDLVWVVPCGIFLLAAMAFRARAPFSASSDFRYILSMTILVSVAIARCFEAWRATSHLKVLALASVCAFTASSFALYSSYAFR